MSKKYVNLGCGQRFHKDWINLDIVPSHPSVIRHNILRSLPFDDNSIDVIYHSHVLEHLPRQMAVLFIRECFRVMKPGGVIRVVVPDLENIAVEYLKNLKRALAGEAGSKKDYDWSLLELYDQVMRNQSGGQIKEFVMNEKNFNAEYLQSRWGEEVQQLIIRTDNKQKPASFKEFLKMIRNTIKFLPLKILQPIYGQLSEKFKEGSFRRSGEIHQWMYDRYSLERLLTGSGFVNFEVKTAFESRIPGWTEFQLDQLGDKVIKPDSIFVEAIK